MASLEQEFRVLEKACKGHSSFVVFGRFVLKQKMTNKAAIGRYFNKFVDKDDYDPRDRETLKKHFYEMAQNKGFLGVSFDENRATATKGGVPSPVHLFL